MKFAASALIGLALMAGNTGCCLFHCGSFSGCDGFPADCGGCDDVACGEMPCDDDCGYHGCGLHGCGEMGCGPICRIFNWCRCRDCCDCCGNWSGPPIVSHNQGWNHDDIGPSESYGEPAPEMAAGRVVPGSMKVTTRSGGPSPAMLSEQAEPVARRQTAPAAQRRTKRISSSPMRAR